MICSQPRSTRPILSYPIARLGHRMYAQFFKCSDEYLYSMSMSSCLNRLDFIIVKRSTLPTNIIPTNTA